jgi:hypothetical protein
MRTGLAALLALVALGPTAAPASAARYHGCMAESSGCQHRFVAGDLPIARFQDASGRRTRVRVCVRDSEGTRCWRSRRPRKRFGFVTQIIKYRTGGARPGASAARSSRAGTGASSPSRSSATTPVGG